MVEMRLGNVGSIRRVILRDGRRRESEAGGKGSEAYDAALNLHDSS
jgi:hypothetical protein